MKTILFAALALTIPAANAAEFAHPDAESVALMGKGMAKVCHYDIVGNQFAWGCYDHLLQGPKVPVQVDLPYPGPVVVLNAKWAFALGECTAQQLTIQGEIDPPVLPPKLNSDLTGTAVGGVCPGWVPLEAGEAMQ